MLDTKAEQTAERKTFVDVKLARDPEPATPYAVLNTDALTDNRTYTFPDFSLTFVGLTTTQTLTNKTTENLILFDDIDATKRAQFSTENQNTQTIRAFEFPPTDTQIQLILVITILVTTLATQALSSKTLVQPRVIDTTESQFGVTINADNLTETEQSVSLMRDATLLSTENVTAEDVSFGAGIGAQTLTGRTRQQQFFYAGF